MVDVACAKAGCFITIDATAGETRARTRTIRNIGFMRVIIKATSLYVQRDPYNKHQDGEHDGAPITDGARADGARRCFQPGHEGRREGKVIKIRSSMPPAAYQRLDPNPTIHMQIRF